MKSQDLKIPHSLKKKRYYIIIENISTLCILPDHCICILTIEPLQLNSRSGFLMNKNVFTCSYVKRYLLNFLGESSLNRS